MKTWNWIPPFEVFGPFSSDLCPTTPLPCFSAELIYKPSFFVFRWCPGWLEVAYICGLWKAFHPFPFITLLSVIITAPFYDRPEILSLQCSGLLLRIRKNGLEDHEKQNCRVWRIPEISLAFGLKKSCHLMHILPLYWCAPVKQSLDFSESQSPYV